MVMNNNFINNMNKVIQSPGVSAPARPRPQQPLNPVQSADAFSKVLKQKTEEQNSVKFSKHAEQRMQDRSISFSQEQLQRLNDAVSKAGQKGVRDSLIVVDNIAVVVNIPNRVVVTAVNSSELKDNVFTNIDGAVFS